jgi:hypothetical protein
MTDAPESNSRSPYRGAAEGAAPPDTPLVVVESPAAVLAPDHEFTMTDGPGLRLVRRKELWPTSKRRLLGAAIAVCTLPAAFPSLDSPARALLIVLGWAAFHAPIARLLVAPERISGMYRVRRELRLPPPSPPTPAWSEAESGVSGIFVDGREVGSTSAAEVRVYVQRKDSVWVKTSKTCLVLIVDGRIYELSREAGGSLGALVARHLQGDRSKLRESSVDFDRWQDEGSSTVSACVLAPLLALLVGRYEYHLSVPDPRLLVVGVLALAARAAAGIERLAVATWPQLYPDGFEKLRAGRPARPIPRLTPDGARTLLRLALFLLYATVASVLAGRC